jgi:hypothetical protein
MVARGSGCRSNGLRRRSGHPGAVAPLPRAGSVGGFVESPAAFGSGARRDGNGDGTRTAPGRRACGGVVRGGGGRSGLWAAARTANSGRRRSLHTGAVAPLPRAGSVGGIVGPPAAFGSGARRNGGTAPGRRAGGRGPLGAAEVARGSGLPLERPTAAVGGRSTPGPWRRCPERARWAGSSSLRLPLDSSGARRDGNGDGTRTAPGRRACGGVVRGGGGRSGLWAAARTANSGRRRSLHRRPWRRCPERARWAGSSSVRLPSAAAHGGTAERRQGDARAGVGRSGLGLPLDRRPAGASPPKPRRRRVAAFF